MYIYVSNESPVNVFFDNLQVVHTRGAMLEETHYYPFGLTMAGISSKALNGVPKNHEKTFQDQRFDDDFGLNWVQFKWRNHDPQIGRFVEIDPLSEKYVYNSTYAFSENKVTAHVELEGLEAVSFDVKIQAAFKIVVSTVSSSAANEAKSMAKKSGFSGEEDGIQDAYRHAYWTARSAQVLTKEEALLFPTLHELDGPQIDANSPEYNPVSVEMDLYNNKVGADIGAENPKATSSDLDKLIRNALENGKLKVVKTTTVNINQEGSDPVLVEVPVDKSGNAVLNGDKTKKVLTPSSVPKGIPRK